MHASVLSLADSCAARGLRTPPIVISFQLDMSYPFEYWGGSSLNEILPPWMRFFVASINYPKSILL